MKYVPDKETKWDYIIQRMNELQHELLVLKEIAKDLGIPECK